MKHVFSVVIPVHSESSIINRTVEHVCHAGAGVSLEVIVVDGDPGGSTIRCIRHEKAVTLISPKGRGRQMNTGASVARGDILLFLHADTELPDQAFSAIASCIDNHYAGGAFDLGIKSQRFVFRLIEQMVRIRTRLTGTPYGDQAIFVTKECFAEVKGFSEIPVMEDVDFMRRIKRAARRFCIIPRKVMTSSRRWEKEGVLFCTLRNWMLISLYLLGVHPDRLTKFYHRDP